MKTADLYIRVSTDEQADKGYSQRSQEELLIKYCDINKIAIRKVIFEDHSAKTFIRPAWQKYLADLKNKRGQTNLLLFLKWDRFSRNAGDAYQMIKTLRKFDVEPQAIEQPLDLSIPENKMMLAFYLAAPEVENDRRALNVIHGMRRASKEGRYMGAAPYGYLNKTNEDGRKHIVIDERAAEMVRWIYQKIIEGIFNSEQIYKLAKEKGFNKTKSLFWDIIRNPTYCGKIYVRKYKDEESQIVKGQHEAIMTESLYYEVQDVLDGRKRGQYKLKVASTTDLPLRGFLICPTCGKLLTGSASKGRRKYYSYYHCTQGCAVRFKTDTVNNSFVDELKKFIPQTTPSLLEAYKLVLTEAWNDKTNHIRNDRKQLTEQIKTLEGKLSYIRDLLSSKQLDPADFREMKAEYTTKLEKLESHLSASDDEPLNIGSLLNLGINNLLKLDNIYETAGVEKKREVIGSMYPEKLTFDGIGVRTTRINEAARFIYMINSDLQPQKKRTNKNNFHLSAREVSSGFEPL